MTPFLAWAAGRARVVWLDGGVSEGDPCEAFAHHGFNGIDGQVVGVVSGFAARGGALYTVVAVAGDRRPLLDL